MNRTWQQFVKLFQSMSSSQRATLIAVPVLLIGAFGLLMYQNRASSYTALSWGKVFTTEELIAAEQAFIQAGLTDFYREGQRIMVPVSQSDRYNAALLEHDALPSDMGSELLKQIESQGVFTSDRRLQETREALLLKHLRTLIRAVPEVEDAQVIIAPSRSKTMWGKSPQVRATVNVKTKAGRELSSRLVESLRGAVANMVPDLNPSDIVVFDTVHGTAYTADKAGDPFDSQLVRRVREFSREYESRIRGALEYIPNVLVTVHVDVENLKSSKTRKQVVDPKKVVSLYESKITNNDASQQHSPRSEVGHVPNRPASLTSHSGPERTRQLTEEDSKTVNAASFEVSEQELIAAMPKAVQVSVSIPKDYYRAVAVQQDPANATLEKAKLDPILKAIETEVTGKVQQTVTRLIPSGSPAESVSVNSVDVLEQETVETPVPLTQTVGELLRQWGGAFGLALFALCALWLLYRSTPKPPVEEPPDIAPVPMATFSPPPMPMHEGHSPPEDGKRESLQSIVRDNPDVAASVLSKWIQSIK